MRPTDSSLRVPGWLVGLVVLFALAAIVTCNFVPGVPLYRYQTFGQRFVGGSAEADPTLADARVLWTNGDASSVRPAGRPLFLLFVGASNHAAERLTHDVLGNGWCAQRISQGFVCIRTVVPDQAPSAGDEGARVATERYRIRTLPTIGFLDPAGNEVERVEGYPGRSTLMHEVMKWEDRFPSRAGYRD